MSKRSDMQDGASAQRLDMARALRDAGFTALLAFGLFLPLIGFQTITDVHNSLILTTRWPLLFTIVAIVGVGRLAYSLAVEPWFRQRTVRRVSAPPAGWRAAVGKWFVPFTIGFVIVYPALVIAINGFGG